MPNSASHSYGSTIKLGSSTITEVTGITGPGPSAETIDVTHLESPDIYKEYIQGFRDGNDIGIEGNFNSGHVASIADLLNTSSLQSAIVTLPTKPSNTRWTANVIVTAISTGAPLGGKIPFNATTKITGKPLLEKI